MYLKANWTTYKKLGEKSALVNENCQRITSH
jgi:hypothetical protein